MAYIEICSGELAGTRHDLTGKLVIGRSAQADLSIPHASISRKHVEFAPAASGQWTVTDLESRNGTTVNGAPIKQRLLSDGDQIAVGEVIFRFGQETSQPQETTAEDAPGFSITSLDRTRRPRISPEHVAAILEFGRALQNVPTAAERLSALLKLAVKNEVGGWWAYALRVSLVKDNLQIRTLSQPANSPLGALREPHISKTVLRAVLTDGEPIVGNKLGKAQRFQAEMTVSPESAKFSAVACPLAKDGAASDILYVILPMDMGTVEWLMLITLAVEQYRTANAAWAARSAAEVRAAHDREMDLARNVQARTLPRRQQVHEPALDWAVRFDPCLSVAGDYVDVVTREDGSVLLLVGDAAGKGMQAALITAGLHAIFQTQGRSDAPLPVVVEAADRYLKTYLPKNSFVTFTAILLDPRTGSGCCVNCGHPPVIAVAPNQPARWIEGGDNLPLSLCEELVQSLPVQLEVGEWLLAYTDGLTELYNEAGEMLGLDRLQQQFEWLCAASNDGTADQLVAKLGAWLDEFRGNADIGDDRTILVARRI